MKHINNLLEKKQRGEKPTIWDRIYIEMLGSDTNWSYASSTSLSCKLEDSEQVLLEIEKEKNKIRELKSWLY